MTSLQSRPRKTSGDGKTQHVCSRQRSHLRWFGRGTCPARNRRAGMDFFARALGLRHKLRFPSTRSTREKKHRGTAQGRTHGGSPSGRGRTQGATAGGAKLSDSPTLNNLDPKALIRENKPLCRGHSLAVKPQPSKLVSPVRSRLPAPFTMTALPKEIG